MSTRSTSIGIGLGTPPDNICRFNIETGSRNNVISNYYGEIRRCKDTAMYVCMPGLTTVKKVTNPNYTTTVSDYTILTESHWRLTGALPLQPYRIYLAMELLYARNIGDKKYEETDHLGNVRFVFTDRKLSTLYAGIPGNFKTDSVSYMDYYPFGMMMQNRSHSPTEYLFGYNGKEKIDEITNNTGSHLDFGARIYDSRVGRWLSLDPLAIKYPSLTPYNFVGNMPIIAIDPNGEEIWIVVNKKVDGKSQTIEKLQYKNGKLYNEDGKVVRRASEYARTVQYQLNQLKQDDGDAKDIITELETNDFENEITNYDEDASKDGSYNQTRDNPSFFQYLLSDKHNATIQYDPYDTNDPKSEESQKKTRNPRAGLIHELTHMFDRNKGNTGSYYESNKEKWKNGK